MRIVAVQTGLSPLSVGGGAITDREFLTRLADRGVEVHLLVPEGYPWVAHSNFVPHFWKRRFTRVHYGSNVDIFIDLRRLLKDIGDVDWVRFNSPYSNGIGAYLATRGKYRLWGSYLHCENFPIWKWIDSWLPARCDLITCLSEATKADVQARCPGSSRSRNVVVPVGIDLERYRPGEEGRQEIRDLFDVGVEDVLVLYVGRLIPRKGISELVQTWRLLRGPSNVHILVIGQPNPSTMGLNRLVAELAKDDPRVHFIREVPHEQIYRYFHASDIFFFPTRYEGFGIVVGEAMASGLPVVTTRSKGVSEVVDDQCALTSSVGDVQHMVKNLQTLMSDQLLRATMGAAGRRRVEAQFTWDSITDRLMAILAE